MLVQVVIGPKSLQKFREPWQELYEADPDANHFLSWPWMSRSLARKEKWFVLVARKHSSAPAAAILPLRWSRGRMKRGTEYIDLAMAGRNSADYTGFLCRPGMEELALTAIARYLRKLPWRRFDVEFFRTTEFRFNVFLEQFQAPDFEAVEVPHVNAEGIDHSRCPHAVLPSTWDEYLAGLGTSTRQRLRRLLRAADQMGLRVTHTDASTFLRDRDILLDLWVRRWGKIKGERLPDILGNVRGELADAHDTGTLLLPVLWQDDRPLAAFSIYVDHHKRDLLFQLGARVPDFDKPAPGLVLHAHCIRWGIENRFARYDFLRGDEKYKYSFAKQERRVPSLQITNKSRPLAS